MGQGSNPTACPTLPRCGAGQRFGTRPRIHRLRGESGRCGEGSPGEGSPAGGPTPVDGTGPGGCSSGSGTRHPGRLRGERMDAAPPPALPRAATRGAHQPAPLPAPVRSGRTWLLLWGRRRGGGQGSPNAAGAAGRMRVMREALVRHPLGSLAARSLCLGFGWSPGG